MNMPTKYQLRKIIGVTLILGAVCIFAYLGWFYFVMPYMVVNQRTTLEQTFLGDVSTNIAALFEDEYADPEGIIVGGLLYPSTYRQDDDVTPQTLELLSREDQRARETLLSVPELDIYDAKIRFEVDGTQENIYNTVLREAVAHFSGTAYPGEKGNFFLFGHSKLPILAGSDYESIFTNLPRLKNGALIEITQEGTVFKYRVNNTAVLSPNDVFILNQPEHERLLTLMTCIPPGFNSKRYVAVASLVGVETV